MQVFINGEARSLAGIHTVADLVRRLEMGERIAVEINERIVPRSEFESHPVRDGDRVEIVQAIGGGAPETGLSHQNARLGNPYCKQNDR